MNKTNNVKHDDASMESAATDELALFTDLYELTMLQAYYHQNMHRDAVFTLFFRRLPERRNFMLACGLDTVLEYLENLRFTENDIHYLRTLDKFSEDFLNWLRDFRFTGQVRAVAEGTPVFPNEPILEVKAPIAQAQLIETFVMNQIHLQTILASKVQRLVKAAGDRPIVDFGARRMHGIDAALKGARAFYIGGLAATSNVLAGKRYGIPVTGTMAHSYIQAHEDEAAAFKSFASLYPRTVLLVDTYDTLEGVRKVIDLAKSMGDDFKVRAVRLDSGDLLELSRKARLTLDSAGLNKVEIFASGGLDEDAIQELLESGAPIDGFGVGTSLGVAEDAPSLDIAYKLSEYAGRGRLKLSSGKPILPGRKQVFRFKKNGQFLRDSIGRKNEKLPGQPLLEEVMLEGERLPAGKVELDNIRKHAQARIKELPGRIRRITPASPPYLVEVSKALTDYQSQVEKEVSS
ncbi:MAG: nicotinate phosphoribosyltransferase [Desulfonatronovibrio sp.]